ncbi:uncharacterized protein LOC127847710 isoform X4 [Dreissena polymorpha]|uniref:uncharacterized protein LOC127847710 isoform X4 n=1 Tax=Dreissena polymorpha TaxID=45954 RepID=UPI002264FAD4|nr:uncharacterized protein LOC127847710 isoform X4 [Dreissena polymorpha]
MEERLTKKEAQNWFKCMFATYTTRDVIAQLADLGFKAFYLHVRSDMRAKHGILETNTCCLCSDPSKLCQLCSEICIRLWENHRFKKSKLKGPSWSNTDTTKWCTESWELAKCYMPPTGYRDKPNANSTDFNGIIGAIYNCTWMQCYFTDDLSKDSNICAEAREEVNKLRHLQDMEICDGDMISFFDCFFNLLNDPAHLNSFKPAIDARAYLKQLQQDTLPLSEKAVKSTLKKVYEDQKEEFRRRLIQFYTTTKETVSVSPLREGHDKPILDVFVQPKLSHVTMEKDGTRKKTEHAVHSYNALFYEDKKLNSRVFVQGEPGMGKTTFLTKLALDWCDSVSEHNPDHKATFKDVDTLKEFRFFFQISLRDAANQREVIEMIKTQIIDMIYSGDKREETVKLLPQILERESCIITLDGLNEWVDCLNKCVIPLMTQCLTKCVSVITTRPWKMVDERIKNSEIKTLIEIEGILDAEELAKKILHSLQTNNVKTHTCFVTYVNDRRLRHFLASPWRLTLLVNLWMNYEVNGSLCEINCILLDILFKNANASKGYFRNGTSFQCLANTRFIKQQIDIFDALANAAFSLTFSSNKCVAFNERELLIYMTEVQLDFCLRSGVLTKRYSSTMADQDAQFSFVHETVQEFLAAYHIANSNQDLIEYFHTDTKYNVLEMSETIIYLCGLECKKANTLINHLADVNFLYDINHGMSMYVRGCLDQREIRAFHTDNNTERNILRSDNNSMDYDKRCIALSVLFQRMIIAGYIEAKASGEKEIFLNCMDFTFNAYLNKSDLNALKMLLMSNKSNIRSLISESNILQTSEILTVMQHSALCVKRVIVKGTTEINKALCNTSIQEVCYTGKFDVSSSCVFPHLSQLTFLKIVDSTFSEDIVLPDKIQRICLLKCACTAVFLRRLLVRLSSLKHDVLFEVETLSVTESNTHIFQLELLSCDMKNIKLVVIDGNIDLYQLIRYSSIGTLGLTTADCASLASETLHTLNKLTELYLWWTYTGQCGLKLPASLRCISLVDVKCSSELLCSLLITLSSFDHPVTCELLDVVLQPSEDTLGDESHTHVSDLRSEMLSLDMSKIEIMVTNGSKELFEIFRDTSIGILDLSTADCASLASEILHTLNKLTKLDLWGTYTGRCDIELPASLQCISLQKGECSSEWLCSLLITLSSFDHPVTCELWDVVLQSSGDTLGDELHTHVSDLRSEIMSHDMSKIEIMVTNGSTELFEILRDASIGILYLRTADCASLASEILHTLNKLTKLDLWGTYTGRCDIELPASLQCISLQKVECSSEWLCSLLITLSSLDHPVRCELYDIVLMSSEETIGDESHTHELDTQSKILSHDMSNIKICVKNGSMGLFEILRDTSIGSLRV